MKYRAIGFLCMVVCVSGCATTQTNSSSNLKIQMKQLERRVDARDAEIIALKQELSSLTRIVNELEIDNQDNTDNFKEFQSFQSKTSGTVRVAPKKIVLQKPAVKKKRIIKKVSIKNDDIVRVNVDRRKVQAALKNAGYYEGVIDGKIGGQSKQAISDFQKDHDLEADGIIGQKTWAELKTYLD